MQHRHRIRLTGLAIEDNQVLLVQHISPRTGLLRWSTPGGGLELSDPDIYRGVEREMLEETGLDVRAGELCFMNEFFDLGSQVLMVDLWIRCYPAKGDKFGQVGLHNARHDDHIVDLRWWDREGLLNADHRVNTPLLNDNFWNNVHSTQHTVIHLGRWEE